MSREDFERIIRDAVSAVRSDSKHDLRLGLRRRLWTSLGDVDNSSGSTELGPRRRAALGIAAAKKALLLWDAVLPHDRLPHDALNLAGQVLRGAARAEEAKSKADQWWTRCDNLMMRHQSHQSVILAGYGAVQSLRGALSDDLFACQTADEGVLDEGIEPYDQDPSFFSAAAFAKGAVWEDSSDPQKRLEFWMWWLTSAVPESLR